jgi:hypothetical protein
VGSRPVAAVLAVLVALFVLVGIAQLRRPASSCGCFGRLSARPSALHPVVNALLAALAVLAAVTDAPGLGAVLVDGVLGPTEAVALVVATAVAAWLVIVTLTVLPATVDAAGRAGRPHEPAGVRPFSIEHPSAPAATTSSPPAPEGMGP